MNEIIAAMETVKYVLILFLFVFLVEIVIDSNF